MASSRTLQCMEILGGLGRREERIAVPGLEAFLLAEPAPGQAAGGDVQYASMCSAGRISRFAVADVSGHGEEVAHFGLGLRDLMRKFINTPNQERMIRELNDELGHQLDGGLFATAVVVTWFEPAHQAFVCTAGHPDPLWYSAELDQWMPLSPSHFRGSGAVENPDLPTNLPLGIIDGTEYEQFTVPVGDGDILVLYTDHYIEAAAADGSMPGVDGLLAMAREAPVDDPERFARSLEASIERHLDGAPIEDDRSLLVIRADESNRPHLPLVDRIRGAILSLVPAALDRSQPRRPRGGRA